MEEVTKVLPAIALRGTTILPDMIVHFDISRPKSVRAVEEAMLGDQKIFLITQKDPDTEVPDRKSTRLNSSHMSESRMPSSA